MQPPQFPCGPFATCDHYSPSDRDRLIQEIAKAPDELRIAARHLDAKQLDSRYKNWSVRQIVHHIADSHVHSYVRFKWALTEDCPTIKAYDEGDWSQLEDARLGDIEPSLYLLDGLHQKWTQLLNSMTEDQFRRSFNHPQTGETTNLWMALNYYAWHSRHHTGQILWLDKHRLES